MDEDLASVPIITVKLIVGPTQEELEVREDLICSRCPFFLNAFHGNFAESKTKTIQFPDDDPENFRDLIKWLQNDQLIDVKPNPTLGLGLLGTNRVSTTILKLEAEA